MDRKGITGKEKLAEARETEELWISLESSVFKLISSVSRVHHATNFKSKIRSQKYFSHSPSDTFWCWVAGR